MGALVPRVPREGTEQGEGPAPRTSWSGQRWAGLGLSCTFCCKTAGHSTQNTQSTAQYQLHRLSWLRALGVSRTRSEVSGCTCGVWPQCCLGMACPWVALPTDCPCDTLLIWPHPCPAFWEGRPPLSLVFAAACALLRMSRVRYRHILGAKILQSCKEGENAGF